MKRVLFFITVIASFFIIQNLVQSIVSLWQKQDLLVKAQLDLASLKQEKNLLSGKLEHVTSEEFIEEEARNKLILAKEGEQYVVIPKKLVEKPKAVPAEAKKAYWQEWLSLFL